MSTTVQLNRSVSAMPRNGSHVNGIGNGTGWNAMDNDSPLKLFVLAKKKINDVFGILGDYCVESQQFLSSQDGQVTTERCLNLVSSYCEKVKGIRDVLVRDHMKVAFFGRTSNGKSSVINAVLHNKILPSGLGHTTNCFLQVEGTDEEEPYLIVEDDYNNKMDVESVLHLGNALNSEKLGDSTLVRIFWPKSKCSLLRDDVVLVDSPGIDVSPNLDEWIDRHCLDADVFVLVSNAESTLMQTEKAFFHKVNEKLSKPNVFILNNRWDASASEPEMLDKVRKQHLTRDIAFLCDELNVVSHADAESRVYFISAKEVLEARLRQQRGEPVNNGRMIDGFQGRYYDFENFEQKFEELLSKSAVKTKFDQHTQRGKKIAKDLGNLLDAMFKDGTTLKEQKQQNRDGIHEKLDFTQQQMQLLTNEVKHQICHLVEQVEYKVSSALSEEIRRLSLLINDYEKPFNSEQLVLAVYKKELHNHVEKGLGSNLRARLSSAMTCCVESAQTDMIERISSLLPPNEERKQQMLKLTPRQNFEILYRINCESLCADFQEDLEFRFSFGLMSIIRNFTNGKFVGRQSTVPKSLPSTAPQTPSNEGRLSTASQHQDIIQVIERVSSFTSNSQSTVGVLALGGLMVRTVGWRIIAITGGIYAILYLYERLTWTNKAKERAFKRQYVNHATKKLRLIVDLTSANCSHQVQQELTSTFARLSHHVDETTYGMKRDINQLDEEIVKLEECIATSRKLRSKANFILSDLNDFAETYLDDEN